MFPETLKKHWNTIGFVLLLMWFAYFQGITALAVILFAAAIHELGHLMVLWVVGGSAQRFSLSADGMAIRSDSLRLSYGRELAAVLAGPMVNLLAGWILSAAPWPVPWRTAAAGACWVLGVFNLLPAASLDGGRFLQLILAWKWGPAGERAAAICGSVSAYLLSAGLLILMYLSGGNLWLLPAAVSMAVSAEKVRPVC